MIGTSVVNKLKLDTSTAFEIYPKEQDIQKQGQ